ncbi:sulfotransferase domain-containing protein [Gloeocapsopsis crepidinum LEGE 06123]|uniref:Sulfotransferase domain-containing protein n=1 Tax=Gloeocapsopsis crepidinum LEGE 06123 TaxID=588587 RepID=A0ABR9UVZ1_9CHRO|nr:sulfotransferase domain-containing protein [Gloeocapsopsis crepidinum]MBE9192465.1 sulfotransferase domain-containing protein [Gloeocapsopsis crepidinum LEGE 06123]
MQLVFSNETKPTLAFFGHHKGATTWIRSVLRKVCSELRLKYAIAGAPNKFDYNLSRFIDQNKIDFLFYVNADYRYVNSLSNFKGFHVVRDPRDIIVSGYFSHRYSHSTENWEKLISHRAQLEKVSKEEGLLLEMEFSRQFLEEMYHWNYNLPNVLELKMEDMIQNPYESFVNIFQFLEVIDDSRSNTQKCLKYFLSKAVVRKLNKYTPFEVSCKRILMSRLLEIVYINRFTHKSQGRRLGEEDITSHYRKGVPGDWKNHFNSEHVQFFKANYNDLLLKLGYESCLNWEHTPTDTRLLYPVN